jgi:spore maturation protein CgeB
MPFLASIKRKLKRVPLIRDLAARVRAATLRRQLASLRESFHSAARANGVKYFEREVIDSVRGGLRSRGAVKGPKPRGSLRIFWAGTSEAQDRSGFLQSLQKFGNVTAMTGAGGAHGFVSAPPKDPSILLDDDLRKVNSRMLLEQVERESSVRKLDVLMGQMWANYISPEALRTIQAWGIATINVSMDDMLPEHWRTVRGVELGSIGLRSGLDLVLTTTRESCLWYAVRHCPAIYWPLASDPSHFPGDPEGVRDLDIVFVGSRYGIRDRIVGALAGAGLKVDAFGPGWANGPVSADETTRLFARAKIVLGVGTVGHTDDVYTIKLRDFDAPMSGALYLTHRNPELLQLFREGDEIVCYDSPDEAVAQAHRLLADSGLRVRVAKAGSSRARRDHTWEGRFANLFRALDLLD